MFCFRYRRNPCRVPLINKGFFRSPQSFGVEKHSLHFYDKQHRKKRAIKSRWAKLTVQIEQTHHGRTSDGKCDSSKKLDRLVKQNCPYCSERKLIILKITFCRNTQLHHSKWILHNIPRDCPFITKTKRCTSFGGEKTSGGKIENQRNQPDWSQNWCNHGTQLPPEMVVVLSSHHRLAQQSPRAPALPQECLRSRGGANTYLSGLEWYVLPH